MRALIIAVAMASVAWSVRGASLSTLLEPSAEGETKVPPLRVCADPDNMPYSRAGAALRSRPTSERAAPSDPTSEERGFEIEIAELLARRVHMVAPASLVHSQHACGREVRRRHGASCRHGRCADDAAVLPIRLRLRYEVG
jgi:hypothetical protein